MSKSNSSAHFPTLFLRWFAAALAILICQSGWLLPTWALDRTDFPIKVYIDPLAKELDGNENKNRHRRQIFESTMRVLRVGVSDWNRLLSNFPEQPGANEAYVALLHKIDEPLAEDDTSSIKVFTLVEKPEMADLLVEGIDSDRVASDNSTLVGRFHADAGYKIGRIELALNWQRSRWERAQEDYESDLRVVLMHELGHALGLAHVEGENCNLMAPETYYCATVSSNICPAKQIEKRCTGLKGEQITFVRKIMNRRPEKTSTTETGVGSYEAEVINRIRSELIYSMNTDNFNSDAQLLLTIVGDGSLRDITIRRSFGSEKLDNLVMRKIKKIFPLRALPESRQNHDLAIDFYWSNGN